MNWKKIQPLIINLEAKVIDGKTVYRAFFGTDPDNDNLSAIGNSAVEATQALCENLDTRFNEEFSADMIICKSKTSWFSLPLKRLL